MTRGNTLAILILILVIYLIGAYTIDLMDNDATQYYTISMVMYESGNFMEISWRPDHNYLDKPPMLFWLNAFFFSIFGANHFVYRLPSILINLLGIYSTYRLGRKLYNEETGLYSAIIYASCFGVFIFSHDVRTDTLMTGFMIFTIWQLYEYLQQRKALNFILGFVGIGLSILTKGPLGLVIPALALGPHLIYQRRWKDVFRPEWLLGLLIIGIVLIPMIFSVYTQHGMHGLRFHFWTQSFGRITGENVWVDNTGPLFFLHSFIWSFIPWTFFALIAYAKKWIGAFKNYGKNTNFEVITLSGITLVFIVMSMSSYKLPHYTYVVFPLVAILSGAYIQQTAKEVKWEGFGKVFYISQNVFNLLLWAAVIVSFLIFSDASFWIYLTAWFAFSYYFYSSHYAQGKVPKLFTTTIVTMLGVAFILNTNFYPGLNPYQGRVEAGKYIKEQNIAAEDVMIYNFDVHKATIDVYSGRIIPRTWHLSAIDSLLVEKGSMYVFTDNKGLDSLHNGNYQFLQKKTFRDYQISLLSLPFLNPNTREGMLNDLHLVKVARE